MIRHTVKVSPSQSPLPKTEQLAWKIAAVATDHKPILDSVTEMIGNRIIDNTAVAIAAINRTPVVNARSQAFAHPRHHGATLFGIPSDQRFEAEWATWANATAVRELDMHDTFLAADYSHPADNIPALIAVGQQCQCSGQDLIRGIAVAYEIQINLVRGICLHAHKKDHVAHLAPATAAGIGAMLKLDTEIIYQAVQHAVHVSFATRQSRKGEISSWKAYAPAHVTKLAVEAIDRAMRGEKSPSPIYEGEDSVIAWMLGGKDAVYEVPLPAPGEPCQAILDSYTKEHSAEYQSQAWIDLAFKLKNEIHRLDSIRKITIYTSHHTHYVIGTGANDPQKMDPDASRETLDHSLMYIFAAALYTGFWHHVKSYARELTHDPKLIALWHKISTQEDPEWTRRYHSTDPQEKAFGGHLEIQFDDGTILRDKISVANAHPLGARPFKRPDYIRKFISLTEDLLPQKEAERLINQVENLHQITPGNLSDLNVVLPHNKIIGAARDQRGIF